MEREEQVQSRLRRYYRLTASGRNDSPRVGAATEQRRRGERATAPRRSHRRRGAA
ncbi:hypothetical protein NKG94_37980 [Micromonospora sp. M12]